MSNKELFLGKYEIDEKGFYVPLENGRKARPVDVIDSKLVFAGSALPTPKERGIIRRSTKWDNNSRASAHRKRKA